MYLPFGALNQNEILEPYGTRLTRGATEIFAVKNLPEMLARNATKRRLNSDMPTLDEDLVEALFRLSEEYDIDFPGIGCLAIITEGSDAPSVVGHTYTTVGVVDGYNMHHDMTKVPFDVTVSTVDRMLTYYENMSRDFSSRLYLADLSLRQCIFGRMYGENAGKERQPRVNFVDYDRRLSNIAKIVFGKPFTNFGEGFGGIAGLDDDLYALKNNFPDENFDGIARRLLGIADHQGIFYKVPTAYYQVKDLSTQSA